MYVEPELPQFHMHYVLFKFESNRFYRVKGVDILYEKTDCFYSFGLYAFVYADRM